jgi:hypothetical protein
MSQSTSSTNAKEYLPNSSTNSPPITSPK